MFDVGDYIIYGSNGVCKITNVGPMKVSGLSKDKLYYTLIPCYIRDSEIFTPVDNERVVMRRVMTKEEANQFVQDIDAIGKLKIIEEKKRELEYRQAIHIAEEGLFGDLAVSLELKKDEVKDYLKGRVHAFMA